MNKKRKLPKITRALPMLFLWLLIIGIISFLVLFIYIELTLPAPESIAVRKVTESTKIYDRTGEALLYDIHGEERRTIIPWDQISESAKKATLASEDADFYNHKGLDITGIIRALLKDIRDLDLSQGGSTITQQLVKKTLMGDAKTLTRKIKEALLSIEVEKRYTKDEILWMYLNQIPYGSNAYGIEAASKTFFGKTASELTVNEAAILASLIKAPSYYSPYGNNTDALIVRKNTLLERMAALNFITTDEYEKAANEEVEFRPRIINIQAPHFVVMVTEYLENKYGRDAVESGGLKVITTLDAELQTAAEETVSKYAEINKEKYKASNAALVAINPKTGELLSLVGSVNYFDIENEGNFNVATAKRQPGSAFKPFAYAVAFQKGYPDFTVLFDVKTEFSPNCAPEAEQEKDEYDLDCYHPRNYDGRFRGPVTMRQGLAQSLNVPSVKTLYLAGVSDTLDLAENMGITTLEDRSRFGLSLVLGGAEVKPVDIVSAYGVFANDGTRNPWYFIKRIESANGTTIENSSPNPKRVLDPQTARLVSDVLSDNSARAPVFGYSSSLYFPGSSVAAKTGTTQENRDAWVIGYSPTVATGVWVGNNRQESMTQEGAGISAGGPMWHEFMVKALTKFPNEEFIKPDLVSSSKPMLNGSYDNSDPHNILYYANKSSDQFENWEFAVRRFFGL
ncbi:MAG: penicillin-binding protein [Candidatus Yanofskybacteria bacterium]|nr:penicillin-binding protein [Candidatus Yanofskybacteria bacterium]